MVSKYYIFARFSEYVGKLRVPCRRHAKSSELGHDKTNKMICAPSEDSDQPGHPPNLIRVFAARMNKAWALRYPHWAHSEYSAQTVRMQRLIWVFPGRTCHFVGFIYLIAPKMAKTFLICLYNTKFKTNSPYLSVGLYVKAQHSKPSFNRDWAHTPSQKSASPSRWTDSLSVTLEFSTSYDKWNETFSYVLRMTMTKHYAYMLIAYSMNSCIVTCL